VLDQTYAQLQARIQEQSEAAIKAAEDNRRERQTMDATPMPGVLDYSHSGNIMELAMGHLRESVPNGQKERTEQAFRALKLAMQNQEAWLRAKGYTV